MQQLLADGLDQQAARFVAYRAKSADIERRRAGGVGIPPEERAALTEVFLQDYQDLASQQRLALRFDTTELIPRESARVQEACGLETSYLEIRDWLLQVLPSLPNTVVLLAGRPPAPLREELRALAEQSGACSFQDFELGGLSPTACAAYLAELQEQEPRLLDIPEEVWALAWQYSEGHPIRLSLVIDLILNGRDIADLFPPHDEASAASAGNLPVVDIDRYLIEQLLDVPEPDRSLLIYLALARKGLDAGLVHTLEPEWPLEECQARLEALRRFTFVKGHTGTAQLFIHDELYALFDRYLRLLSVTGMAWHNCPGNHDMNLDCPAGSSAFETWKRVFGPPHYAFQHGQATFILLNNVEYFGALAKSARGGRGYRGRIGEAQLAFVASVLRDVFSFTLLVAFLVMRPEGLFGRGGEGKV